MVQAVNSNNVFKEGAQAVIGSTIVAVALTLFFLVIATAPGASQGYFFPTGHPIAAAIIFGPEAVVFVYGLIMMAIAGCMQKMEEYRERQPAVQPDSTIYQKDTEF